MARAPPRGMRDPLVPAATAMVLGAWLYPHWEPGALGCLCGVLLCSALGLRGRLALVVAAFWLGSLAPAAQAPGEVLRGPVALSGRVELAWGRTALVARAGGDRVLLVTTTPLATGDVVHAFGRAGPVWTAVLPGEPDPELAARTARVKTRVVALDLSHPQQPRRLQLARHEGLLHALVTGDRSLVPATVTAGLRATGTSHLLAVSGLHVGLLAGLAALFLRPVLHLAAPWMDAPRWVLPLLGTALVLVFSASVGWPISTRRAAVMVAGALLATALGRSVRPWNLLGLAAMLSVLAEPLSVRTLSFQMSFGAVAGMLSLRWPRVSGPARWVVGGVGATLGATLGTLPATAWALQELPVTGPLANLVAVPAVGLMLPCALVAWHTGWLFPLALADTVADSMLVWLAWMSGPVLHPAVGPLGAMGLLLAVLWPRGRCALLLLSLGLRSYPAVPRVTFLSVGQGDAALIEGEQRILVDGGPPGDRLLHYLRRRGIRRLDTVVLSHAHPDHGGGLEAVLRSLRVEELRLPRLPAPGEDRTLLELAVRQNARIVVGSGLHPSEDFLWEHHADLNESSLVHLEAVGELRVLFTGDIEAAGEAARSWPRADVLKVPHHGSRSSSSVQLVSQVQPRLAVMGCGRDNRFGHPHPEVLRRYPRVLRTDLDGTIEVSSVKGSLQVRSWLPGQGWTER